MTFALGTRRDEWDSCVACRATWPCDAELLAELVITGQRLSENTVDSLDEPDVERLATAICATRLPVVDDAEGWRSDDECRAWAIRAVRLAATAASDASESATTVESNND